MIPFFVIVVYTHHVFIQRYHCFSQLSVLVHPYKISKQVQDHCVFLVKNRCPGNPINASLKGHAQIYWSLTYFLSLQKPCIPQLIRAALLYLMCSQERTAQYSLVQKPQYLITLMLTIRYRGQLSYVSFGFVDLLWLKNLPKTGQITR